MTALRRWVQEIALDVAQMQRRVDALRDMTADGLERLHVQARSAEKVLRAVVQQGLHAPGSECRRWLEEHPPERDP